MSTKIKLSDGCIVAVVDAINFAIKTIDEQQKYKMYLDLIDSPDKSGEISSIVNQKKIFQHEKELLHNAIMTVQNAGNTRNDLIGGRHKCAQRYDLRGILTITPPMTDRDQNQ